MASGSASQHQPLGAGTSLPVLDPTEAPYHHDPAIFTIICCNESFQFALSFADVKTLLLVCKRARHLLNSKERRFNLWCSRRCLKNDDGSLQIRITPSDRYLLSFYCPRLGGGWSWLEAQSNSGNAAAAYFLARNKEQQLMLASGYLPWKVQDTRMEEVLSLLEQAALDNHTMAQFHLARCYMGHKLVHRDATKALGLYRRLANRGLVQAQLALGRMYEDGEGVKQSFSTAIEWYTAAWSQGSEDARLRIVFLRGCFSFIGHGVEKSDQAAFNHWQEVSTQSTNPVIKPIATHMVGWMHYLGRGTLMDQRKGIQIIRDNETRNRFRLGEDVWFWSTKGFYSNINLHLHHLQASAAQGNQFAQLLLGEYQSSNDRGAAFAPNTKEQVLFELVFNIGSDMQGYL
ncbi:uncharacterized protein BJ171DRAFT_601571 [Polychytrium aggregatum]|uniref:uncharacterized protein n=1 Tax=Polychytrium aggregatum TaxID=110093 RepID=UPI0022FE43B2|nr:uncharacterized protein BJ171DRAFT_601571 [Polychytrium aggregatum]KAI9199879.1 hypothetical protein BJ171DRAFT_601571 [Polychytrium aggregatum]